ncbi:AMP nucleosidase [Elstera cyanobacteriorum]|uniref:AMP nucleosidase n=1 Tax=Elstera cyanobacteriorum TaxID=2022747 RepID=UPI003B5B4FE5
MMDLRAPHAAVADGVEAFTDADAALARIAEIYDRSAGHIRAGFEALAKGGDIVPNGAYYPYLGITVTAADLHLDARFAYGVAVDPGAYGTTLTRPSLLADYYRDQIHLLIQNHKVPVYVGVSKRPIPLPFVIENATADVTETQVRAMAQRFALPDLNVIDDSIANGTHTPAEGLPRPLSLFTAERVDYSIARLGHYTATAPQHFQRFVLLTNYQRYVDEFCAYGKRLVAEGDEYDSFVEPGDVFTPNPRLTDKPASGTPLVNLPQMPAYHLTRPDKLGITMVNIGVGPSNAKTITDHLAVLRPHCWLMLGHCAGLRRSQFLGDYVLAHGYVRDDQVLDADLPPYVPVPPIAEVQVALQQAVAKITGLEGADLKSRLRTGSVLTTDNRNWELRFQDIYARLNQSRAIAVDMESATIAANGFRFRVPYGTLLCVSDKPLHGEIKLRGMANAMYRERIAQHLEIGIETIDILRAEGVRKLHSRKLRSFDEPSFR